MPLCRYQIRNEYTLADPDLYRAADKDDPEALLEGVAMAGLVGVLRQLGDLAEFAAEIFHDLHEQVMSTASRGHSLTVRVQQLEAEFPSIEKAFLSQTSHSSFYYNAGTDWHPNLRMDQNLITQGDLPRFIMDSYEECRGPPRLFLLDKFDVAGAGACLKRYTDPSVFKVETSYSDILRDKKIRKAKHKKGSRWRNGETPETLPTSHAKLHQLFLEERSENDTNNSTRRVKLKRRLNGFPFDTKAGKSYMEKFFKSPSPNHEEVHEIPVDLSPLALPSNGAYESTFEIVEISTVSPQNELEQRMRSSFSSPAREETTLELATDELNEVPRSKEILEVSKAKPGLEAHEFSSTLHTVVSEKDIPVYGGMKTEDSIDDSQSDDVLSEIDNYVDALTTMESEIDTDSELRAKHDLRYLNSRGQASDVDANDEQVQAHSSDSLSLGNSTLSDDGSSSSKKDLSRFSYSDTHSTSAENTPVDGEVSSNVLTSSEIHEAEPSPIQQSIDGGQLSQPPEDAASDGAFGEAVEIPSHSSELGGSSSSASDSDFMYKNAEAVVKEIASVGPETDDMVTLSMDLPFIPSIADLCRREGDYLSPQMSGEAHVLDEFEYEDTTKTDNLGCTSCLSVPSLSKHDLPLQVPCEKQFVDELDDEDANQDENLASISNCLIVPRTEEENKSLLCPENQPLDEFHDEHESSSAAISSDVLMQNRDEVSSPTTLSENLPVNDFGVEEPNFILEGSIGVPKAMEVATEKKITENILIHVPQISHVIDNSVENNLGPQNSVMPHLEDQPNNQMNEELETHHSSVVLDESVCKVDDATPSAGERAENLIFKVDTSITGESVEPGDSGAKDDVPPLETSQKRTSYLTEEYCDQPSNIGYCAVMDETVSNSDLIEGDTTAEPSVLAGVHAQFNEVDYEPVTVATAFADHDDDATDVADDFSSIDLKKLQEGSISSFGDEHSGLEINARVLNRPEESDVTDDVYLQKFASHDLNSLHYTVIDDDLVSGAESGLKIDNASTTQSSVQLYEQDPHDFEENFDLHPKQLGKESQSKVDANSGLTKLQQTHFSDHNDQVGTFDMPSESLLDNIPSQPSALDNLPQANDKNVVSEHYLDPSSSVFSSFPVLPDSGQIYVEEMPPLPPLPPVQWRMGKFQNASPAPESVKESHDSTACSLPLSSSVYQEAQALDPFLPQPALAHEKPTPLVSEQPVYNSSPFLSEIPPVVHHGDPKHNILPLERVQCMGTPLELSGSHCEMLQNDAQDGKGEKVKPSLDSLSQAYVTDAASSYPLRLSHEGLVKPLNQMVPETSLNDVELGQRSSHSEENIPTCDTTETSVQIANEDSIPTLEDKSSWPTIEDGKLQETRTTKLPRPRNPLIDAVVALDKSKLRKVTDRVKPQMQKEDERDSLLEQIRTKSFNLKHTVVTRPSIQGPKTNLRVAAILEKAKTIRQAFAGSDEEEEDDDDGWSDS